MKMTVVRNVWSRKMAAWVCLLATWPVFGQAPAAAEAPVPRIGEIRKYRTIDLWTGRETSTFSLELLESSADRLTFRNTSATGGVRTVRYTKDLNPCRTMRNSDVPVCAGVLKFPLAVGSRHGFENLPSSNGESTLSEQCVVKAHEVVTVPAGTYDAFRIECAGEWKRLGDTNNSAGAVAGRLEETHWYAPRINGMVKWLSVDYRSGSSGGGVYNRNQTELIDYSAPP